MPRMGRLHIDGGCYHVMGRGFERRNIFEKNYDKQDFINRLGTGLETTGFQCFAWSIMPNHYHLLIKVSTRPLSDLMRKLLSGFATAYNRRHDRVGYVFQNRFKSILCDEEQYLLQLVRYIHRNPINAGIVANIDLLDRYPWTGHAALMGNRHVQWQEVEQVLNHFGSSIRAARNKYLSFVTEVPQRCDFDGGGLIRSYGEWENSSRFRNEHEAKIGDERILGDSSFVERSLNSDNLDIARADELQRAGWSLDELVRRACNYFDTTTRDLQRRDRDGNISKVKGCIVYFATQELGVSTQELARYLNMSRSGVYAANRRGRELLEQLKITLDTL